MTSDASASKPETAQPAGPPEPVDEPPTAEPRADAAPDGDGVSAPAVAALINRVAVGRPVEMTLGAVFLTLAALPLVLLGLALLLRLGGVAPGMAQVPGILVRFIGLALLVVGVLFVGLAWFAVKPRHWARSGTCVFAGVEIVMLFVGMLVTAFDPVGVGLILLTGAGAVLMYLPRSAEFLALSGK